MSLQHGWAALHLQMPPRVPRTEYSAEFHWDLVRTVTGVEVGSTSDQKTRDLASQAFVKAWNYDIVWNTLIGAGELGQYRTRMGHAAYMAAAEDFDDVRESFFSSVDEVLAFDPVEQLPTHGRNSLIARFDEDFRKQQCRFPETAGMTGVYVTCVSGLIDLFGWDLLLEAAGTEPMRFGQLTQRYGEWISQYFEALAESTAPVVMVHDDIVWSSGAIFAPAWYRQFVFPVLRALIKPLKDADKIVLFTADGNFTEFVPDLVACGINGFVMEPLTDLKAVAEEFGRTHVLIGNVDTRVLLNNDRDAIRAEVERCMSIGKDLPGFFLAVGNHIPPNTPVEAALYYNQVYEELSKRW